MGWWGVLAFLLALSLFSQFFAPTQYAPIPYSQFQKLLADGKVAKVTVAGDVVRGEYKEKLPDGSAGFTTRTVPQDLATELSKQGVEYTGEPATSTFGTVLGWILPPLLFVGIWMLASRNMQG